MSEEIKIEGKIKLILNAQQVTDTFRKRGVVVITPDDKYPQELLIEFVQDKCEVLDKFAPGEEVVVSVNLRGSEYNGRYFVNLNGWLIRHVEGVKAEPEPIPYENEHGESMTIEDDDLRF
jgi:hypothetical protein